MYRLEMFQNLLVIQSLHYKIFRFKLLVKFEIITNLLIRTMKSLNVRSLIDAIAIEDLKTEGILFILF